MINKHAYLIMAHNQWEVLKKSIQLLDDERNDIFIHIDAKAKNVPLDEIKGIAKRSRVILTERIRAIRLTYNLYEITLLMLKKAMETDEYAYFHLITGQDLPIKNQDYIHAFFERYAGKNFIDVVPMESMRADWRERVSLYNFMAQYLTPTSKLYFGARVVRKITLSAQRILGVNRLRKYEKQGYQLRYGSAWCSFTKEFAEYMLEKEDITRRICKRWTFIPEESIPQSLLWNSRFRDTLFEADWIDHDKNRANMRMIFWSGKTSPESITMEHVDALRKSPNLFARKFDFVNHRDAVDAVEEMVRSCAYEGRIPS